MSPMGQEMLHAILITLGLLCLPAGNGVRADITAPFLTRNQSPFIRIYGLPFAEDALLAAPRQLQINLITDIANNFTSAETEGERHSA